MATISWTGTMNYWIQGSIKGLMAHQRGGVPSITIPASWTWTGEAGIIETFNMMSWSTQLLASCWFVPQLRPSVDGVFFKLSVGERSETINFLDPQAATEKYWDNATQDEIDRITSFVDSLEPDSGESTTYTANMELTYTPAPWKMYVGEDPVRRMWWDDVEYHGESVRRVYLGDDRLY